MTQRLSLYIQLQTLQILILSKLVISWQLDSHCLFFVFDTFSNLVCLGRNILATIQTHSAENSYISIYYKHIITLIINSIMNMDIEPLPKALVHVMNNVMKDEKCLWWRIHGLPDKIAMNVMWSLGPSRHGNGSTPCTSSNSASGYCDQAIQTADADLATGTKDLEVEEEVTGVKPRGERRKQLPSIPDSKTLSVMANTVNNKPATAHKGGSGYNMFFLEYTLMAEYNKLHKQKLPGVYVIPSALTPLVWNGVLFIRQGQYQDGTFKFTVNIPENFPHGECPRVIFEFPVFHPVVDPHTGEVDVKRAFPKWRPKVHEICQVLLYTRRIFYKIDTKSPLNEEAAQLYEQDMEQFKRKVTETIQKSKDLLYNEDNSQDPHAIIFSLWDPEVHEEARNQMLNSKKTSNDEDADQQRKSGLSWMKYGSSQILSREDSGTA